MAFFKQFYALLVKNWHLKTRRWVATLFEVLLPVLCLSLMVLLRYAVGISDHEAHLYDDDSYFVNPAYGVDQNCVPPAGFRPVGVDVTQAPCMEYLAYKLLQRGHVVSVTPRHAPFCSNESDSFSSVLAAYIQDVKTRLGVPDTRTTVSPNACSGSAYIMGFATGGDLKSYVQNDEYPMNGYLEVGVDFTSSLSQTQGLSYEIRMNQSQGMRDFPQQIPLSTVEQTDDLSVGNDDKYLDMFTDYGLFAWQSYIEGWVLTRLGMPRPSADPGFTFTPFPTPKHREDGFANIIGSILPILFCLAFIWPVIRLVRCFVEEKETRIKEGLKIMGLNSWLPWLSWFTSYTIMFIVTTLLILGITASTVYPYSDKGIIFLFFFLFCECVFAFSWLMASLFSRATVASTVSALIFLGIFFGILGMNDQTTAGAKAIACLSAPICFGLGSQTIATYESAQQGVTASNFSTPTDKFAMSTCIAMLIVDFVLYTVLALYLERVVPSQWGVAQPLWFCLMPKYWCPKVDNEAGSEARVFDDRYERTDAERKVAIAVRNLSKRFSGQTEDEAAVKRVNLDLYEGQVFALLGHNGAGKTTLINMLNGMLQPTSGDALIFGRNIVGDMGNIRQNLGVCPQHNTLYDILTVREHLVMYARIKGVPETRLRETVQQSVERVGLTEKIDAFSMTLSGGMKRKLSVAIALVGNSRTLFLDEPTSGMDPYSRRSTWNIIKQAREGRVVILTTHFMDEADHLGDRIAILQRGIIQCCGSSLFLKAKYGVGYTLTISKTDVGADTKAILSCINRHVPQSQVLSSVAREITCQLPDAQRPRFANLFDEMDEKRNDWGIDSYGVSVTTLEEVFLRVGQETADKRATAELKDELSCRMGRGRSLSGSGQEHDDDKKTPPDQVESMQISISGDETKLATENELKQPLLTVAEAKLANGGGVLHKYKYMASDDDEDTTVAFSTHLKALLLKRVHSSKRDRKVWLWQVVYPSLILIMGVGLLKLASTLVYNNTDLSTSQYNTPLYIPTNPLANDQLQSVFGQDQRVGVAAVRPLGNAILESGCLFSNTAVDSSYNMSRYLLCTWKAYEQTKYGAYLTGTAGASASQKHTIFVNTTGVYSGPIFLNLYNEARARNLTSNNGFQLRASISPWPQTKEQAVLSSSLTSLVAAIAFAFIPAAIIGPIVAERECKSKHLQLISGVGVTAYWVAHTVWDFLNFLPPVLISLAIFKAYAIDALTGDAAGVLLLCALLYAMAIISFTYCVSFLFKKASTAQNIMLMVYIFSGAILLIASIVMDIIPSTKGINRKMKYFYRIVPSYAFGECLINLMTRDSIIIWTRKRNALDFDITGINLVYMASEAVVYFIILATIEKIIASPDLYWKVFSAPTPEGGLADGDMTDLDQDVANEKLRIQKLTTSDTSDSKTIRTNVQYGSSADAKDVILLQGLRKTYRGRGGRPPKEAVRGLWFGIREGECFGFLGINGAGKSTTLKMLTADELPTSGTATLSGFDILESQPEIRRQVGYCPQFDALLPNMTARETLKMYARFKGYPESDLNKYVSLLAKQLGLDVNGWLDKPCSGYSGGNKRKLSVGIALVGNPRIVLLDEPSTGMDPASRRFMWDLITRTMAHRSVILTTHSMEECEALCARIGIMVSGQLQCLGTAQHLKAKYGSGYQLRVKIDSKRADPFKQWFFSEFKGATLLEDQVVNLKFRIPKSQRSLAQIFRSIESAKVERGIVDYSCSETTLEQIFIQFAKAQTEETGAVAGLTDIQVSSEEGAVHVDKKQ